MFCVNFKTPFELILMKKPKDGTLNSLLISTSTVLLIREHVHMLNKLNWFAEFVVYFDNYSNFSADLFLSFSFRSAR